MPTKRFLLILTSFFILTSCVENDRAMGEDFLTEDYLLSVKTKTFDLPVTNKASDSVQSFNSSSMLIGNMTDPVFGTVMSNSASFIIPYSDSTDFGVEPKLISAYLSLSIDSTYFINSNQEGIHQRLNIYKLISEMDTCDGFNNSVTEAKYDPTPITKGQPVIYQNGSIRIDLTDEFGRELLSTSPEEFEDWDLFLEKFPGLFITMNPPMGNTEGGRMNYINLGSSNIYVNYTLNDPERDIKDLDTTEAFAFGYYTAFNNFSTSSEHLETTDDLPDVLYVESLSGIKPHIDALTLKKMLDAWMAEEGLEDHTVILSRAELVFPYEMPEDYDKFNKEHPSHLYGFTNTPWATDSLRYYEPIKDVDYNKNRGAIDRTHRQYSMDLTSHIQDLLSKDISEVDASNNIWIAPMYPRKSDSNVTYYEFNNKDYRKIILNGPGADRRPTMKLVYSVMKY